MKKKIDSLQEVYILRRWGEGFKTGYIEHLQNIVLQFDDATFNKFMRFLRLFNVKIVGRSIMYFHLELSEYNNKLDLFIASNNLTGFLQQLYIEFVPIKFNFSSQYGTYDDNIIEIVFELTNNSGKKLTINLYIYKEIINIKDDIFTRIENRLSIFEICYFVKDDVIYSKYTASKIYDNQYPITNNQPRYILNHIDPNEDKLLLKKNIQTQYFDEKQEYKEYESRIVKELISHLADIHKFEYTYIKNIINGAQQLFDSTNRHDFITEINRNYKLYIYLILDFLIELNNNFSVTDDPLMNVKSIIKNSDINIYTYEEFKKNYIRFFSPSIAKKMNNYIDEVIKEYILKKYEIKINISKNKIKFEYTPIERSIELTENEKDYIGQILLFYYKNRIYKYKHDYKFNNLIVDKFELLDIVNTLTENAQTFNLTLIKVCKYFLSPICSKKPIRKIDKTQHKKILEGKSDINCTDLMYADDIDNIKEYLEKDKDNIVFIDDSRKNATGISKNDLDQLVSNYADNWFFDCSKYLNGEHLLYPFIKLPFLPITYFVAYNDLYSLFDSKQRIFYIVRTGITIAKTASYKNSPQLQDPSMRVAPQWVSANHCQDNSSIQISQIKIIKTQAQAKNHTRISLNKSYSISSTSK